MKTFYLLPAVVTLFLWGCSSPKKAPAKNPSPKVTKEDVLRGGTSFDNAIVIMVEKEQIGIDEEYKWLSINYPHYGLIKRTHVKRASKHYDIIRIKTREGRLKDIYFDSTRFWGKT